MLANPHFGTVVSESGLAYTWARTRTSSGSRPGTTIRSRDASGEAFYLRDEETGHFWSPTPLPAAARAPYVSRHGFGYSVFEHTRERHPLRALGVRRARRRGQVRGAEAAQRVGPAAALSATGYVEWVLGDLRPKSAMHVVTEIDPASGALFARNPYNTEFPDGSRSSTSTRRTGA